MDDVYVDLHRSDTEVTAKVFPLLPVTGHWSQHLSVPNQRLEVRKGGKLTNEHTLVWPLNATDLEVQLSKICKQVFVGQNYTLRILESNSVEEHTVPFVPPRAAMSCPFPYAAAPLPHPSACVPSSSCLAPGHPRAGTAQGDG